MLSLVLRAFLAARAGIGVTTMTEIDPRPSLYQHPMFFGGLPPVSP
jgi:hypothetical protein